MGDYLFSFNSFFSEQEKRTTPSRQVGTPLLLKEGSCHSDLNSAVNFNQGASSPPEKGEYHEVGRGLEYFT